MKTDLEGQFLCPLHLLLMQFTAWFEQTLELGENRYPKRWTIHMNTSIHTVHVSFDMRTISAKWILECPNVD